MSHQAILVHDRRIALSESLLGRLDWSGERGMVESRVTRKREVQQEG
jgi:hypothetical protein